MDQLEERIAELREQEELAKLRPALDGDEIMTVLGVPPGRIVGEAKAFLMEIRLDEGEIPADEARERLLAWAREREVGA
jgi:poly(A) polymerase